jgi:NAD+ diphosphatase
MYYYGREAEVFVNTAFFFQGSSILLPADVPDADLDRGILPQRLEEFENSAASADQFETADLIKAVDISEKAALPPAWRAVPVRQSLQLLSGGLLEGKGPAGRLLRAFHIAQWRRESRFCGSCGTKNTDDPVEQARLCPSCGRLEYPRIAPAVITIVVNERGQVLLAHNKKFTTGIYSLIAGFNEAGENLEQTVEREIWEEVKIEVRDIRYIVSQPWPFPNSLMVGFSARYAGGTIRPDGIEIADARWWDRGSLPVLPTNGSVSRYLIGRWLEGTL